MNKWIFIFLTLISTYSYAQNTFESTIKSQTIDSLKCEILSDTIFNKVDTYRPTPYVYFLILDDFIIQLGNTSSALDSTISANLEFLNNSKWIKKMVIIKDEKDKYIRGNTGGKIYIYPKKRFKKKLLKYFKPN